MNAPANYDALVRASGAGYVELSQCNDEPLEWLISFPDQDLTGATFIGEIIPELDATAGAQALTFGTATLVDGVTNITASLTESQVEGLGTATSPAEPLKLLFNIKVTPSGGLKKTAFAGRLTRVGS